MDKFPVFVYMLMGDASLKQRIPCIIRFSIFKTSSVEKSAHYTQVNTVSATVGPFYCCFLHGLLWRGNS